MELASISLQLLRLKTKFLDEATSLLRKTDDQERGKPYRVHGDVRLRAKVDLYSINQRALDVE